MPNKKRAIIAGSTGETGKRLLGNLIADNLVTEIHLLVRSPTGLVNPKIQQHIVDFNNLDTTLIPHSALLKTIAYCTLGTTIKKAGSRDKFAQVDLEFVINFAHWSLKNECNEFAVISSLGADKTSNNFYLKTKGQMEYELSSLPWKSLWVFRPSLLTGQRSEFRLAERLGAITAKLISPLLLGPLKKYTPIEMDDVAKSLSALIYEEQSGINIIESNDISRMASER